MKKQSFETRVAAIIDAVQKASPRNSSLGIRETKKGDTLDLLVDAIEDLLRRSRESLAAFENAQKAMHELEIPSDSSVKKELSREHILLMDALQANMPDTIYFKDVQSRFINVSKAHAKVFNLISKEELFGKTDFDFFTVEHAREAFEDEQRIIRTGEPVINKEEKETWPDRPATWVLTTKMPLRDPQGTIVGTFGISRDITERKRAEEELKKSEARYRLLFNSINDAILVHEFHEDGSAARIVEVNDVACERLEYSREELLGMRVQEITPPEALAVDPTATLRLRAEGHSVYESMHLSKSGRKFPVEISNRLFELDGRPMIFATVRDITERKQAELALRQEAIRRRILFEEATDGVVVIGQDFNVIEANTSFANMLGYSLEEVRHLRMWDWDVFSPTEELARAKWPEPPTTRGTIETRHRRKDGSVYDVEISFSPAVFSGEMQMYCVCRDVTQRKQLEENLERERALLLTLINNLPDHVSVKDTESRILITNTANAYVMGLGRAQDAIGKTDLDFYPPSEAARYLADEKTIIQTGTALIDKEEESTDPQGHRRWTLTTKVPLRDAQGRVVGVVCTGRDITERKQAETENARASRTLRMLSDSNQALIHITDETTLLNEACRIAVDVGGYRMARVDFVEHDEGKTFRPRAHAGFESGYIESTNAPWTWADNERGRGPSGTAVRTGQPCIVRNTLLDPAFAPWRQTAIQRGYGSVIALPLISEGQILGVLGIYSGEVDAFDTKEVEILRELAGDLAFGVTALRTRAKRDHAERALRESEERYRLIAENTADTITVSDLNLRPMYISPSVVRLRGYTVQETMGQSLVQVLTPESLHKVIKAFTEQMALETRGKGDPSRTALLELEEYCKDGSTIWVELAASFLRDNNLKATGILSVARDITKRRQAEAARQLLASAVEQAAEMIVITDAAALIEYVNPAFETITGTRGRRSSVATHASSRVANRTRPSTHPSGEPSPTAKHGGDVS